AEDKSYPRNLGRHCQEFPLRRFCKRCTRKCKSWHRANWEGAAYYSFHTWVLVQALWLISPSTCDPAILRLGSGHTWFKTDPSQEREGSGLRAQSRHREATTTLSRGPLLP